jgi:phospholipase C
MSLAQIDHVVVLMLENRSFDCMLGRLYPPSSGFDGLTGNESNLDANGTAVGVWNSPGTDPVTMSIPTPDPGELWVDINTQLFGSPVVAAPAPAATMSGFAQNYMSQPHNGAALNDPKNVMHYFSPEQVPVISKLARQFAVCDCWFSSAPCQTWPNRFFVHTGTADGYENNSPEKIPFTMETIYNRFEMAGTLDWRIYFHDIAQSKTLAKLWLIADHFRFYEEFQRDAAQGTLPAYSFIEPRYFSDWSMPNDQHPPHVVTLGEQLIADVYNTVRNGKAWTKTLLVIIYDEHGGCYDHVPPPAAVPPSPIPSAPFNFDRYGVRVPAVIVSPYIQQSTVLRARGGIPYDHTSIIATLRKRFPELGPQLTQRDRAAPDLGDVLTLQTPDNMGPEWIDALSYAPSPSLVARVQDDALNGMQKALVQLAANLPQAPGAIHTAQSIQAHIDNLIQNGPVPIPAGADQNVRVAAAYVKEQLGNFFRAV